MEDERIIELYFARSGDAVSETERKYCGYIYAIAKNALTSGGYLSSATGISQPIVLGDIAYVAVGGEVIEVR